MPKVALADTLVDWEMLLRAATEHADKKGLKVPLDQLEARLRRLRELDALRADLRAQLQAASQEVEEIRAAGKLNAIEIRALLKGIFGHSSERLVQFNMRPRRKYRRTPRPTS